MPVITQLARKLLKFMLIVSLSLFSTSLFATSFDCSKARSFAEITICENPELSKEDDSLKVIYDQAKKSASNKKAFSELARQMWNVREKCKDYECVANWYEDAKYTYSALINNAFTEPGNRVGNSRERNTGNEDDFVAVVKEAMVKAGNAVNDMQIGGVKSVRDREICNILKVKSVSNWTGEVKKVTANSDGKGVIVLSLPHNILIKTWNNSFSDSGYNTLIEPGSKVFENASELKEGDVVYFSGTFFEDGDNCIVESSMTLSGKVKQPEFIFRFSDIQKYKQ